MSHSRKDMAAADGAQNQLPSSAKKNLTVMQSVVTGSVAGATEVLIDHPLLSIKTRMQNNEPLTLNPRLLYRGILPNAASMMPITAAQVALDHCFTTWIFAGNRELSVSERFASAFAAGVGSAFISCPTEMVMTHQGKFGGSFYAASRSLVQQGGWRSLMTGWTGTAMRDGKFAAFLLAATPMLKAKMLPYCPNDYAASLAAGVTAGAAATLVSHAPDTVKTRQQGAGPKQKLGFMGAATEIYTKGGVYGFFKGTAPRGARVMAAVTIIGLTKEKMETQFRKS